MSKIILPLLVLFILIYSYKKINIYETFIEGVKESFSMILEIFPSVLAMIFADNIFTNSNILSALSKNAEIITMIILRPLSGNAALSTLNNIYKIYGPDHFLSFFSSLIQATSDTTFYVLSLYLGVINIKKTRYAPIVCLLADFISIIIAFFVAKLFFWIYDTNCINRATL